MTSSSNADDASVQVTDPIIDRVVEAPNPQAASGFTQLPFLHADPGELTAGQQFVKRRRDDANDAIGNVKVARADHPMASPPPHNLADSSSGAPGGNPYGRTPTPLMRSQSDTSSLAHAQSRAYAPAPPQHGAAFGGHAGQRYAIGPSAVPGYQSFSHGGPFERPVQDAAYAVHGAGPPSAQYFQPDVSFHQRGVQPSTLPLGTIREEAERGPYSTQHGGTPFSGPQLYSGLPPNSASSSYPQQQPAYHASQATFAPGTGSSAYNLEAPYNPNLLAVQHEQRKIWVAHNGNVPPSAQAEHPSASSSGSNGTTGTGSPHLDQFAMMILDAMHQQQQVSQQLMDQNREFQAAVLTALGRRDIAQVSSASKLRVNPHKYPRKNPLQTRHKASAKSRGNVEDSKPMDTDGEDEGSSNVDLEKDASSEDRDEDEAEVDASLGGGNGHDGQRKSQELLDFMGCIRRHFLALLGIASTQELVRRCPPLKDTQVQAIWDANPDAPQCTARNYRIDFNQPLKKFPLNRQAVFLAVESFIASVRDGKFARYEVTNDWLDRETVKTAVLNHLEYLRDTVRGLVKPGGEEKAKAQKKRKSRNSRRKSNFDHRMAVVTTYEVFRPFMDLFGLLRPGNMSTDETDTEGKVPPVYYIVDAAWMSDSFRELLRTIDRVFMANWRSSTGERPPGSGPRQRIPSRKAKTETAPPHGLPINCYDGDWLARLPPDLLVELDVDNTPRSFVLDAEQLKTALRAETVHMVTDN